MLRIFHINDHTALDRIRAWVAVADNRTQLILSDIAGQQQYQLVVDSRDPLRNLGDLVIAEFAEAITEAEFPTQHPAPTNTA